MWSGSNQPSTSLVHAYESSDDEEQSTSTLSTPPVPAASPTSAAAFSAIRSTAAASISPPASLDRRVQQFVSEVSELVDEVEGDEARQAQLLDAAPGARVYSHVDAATGRTYYFDATRRVSVWQRPPAVTDVEQWADSSTTAAPSTDTQQQRSDSSPTAAVAASKSPVDRLLDDVSQLVDRLSAAVDVEGQQTEGEEGIGSTAATGSCAYVVRTGGLER